MASPGPSAVAPTAQPKPARTPGPTARPTPTPTAWTDNENVLLVSLRDDARVDCAPRRSNLPPRAIAGIECRPAVPLVERVGAYLFPTDDSMLQTYQERMDDYGVGFQTGSCPLGIPDDASWASSFLPDDESMPWARIGCYFDKNGTANIRVTCRDSLYVGVLGTNQDMARLYDWSRRPGGADPGSGIEPGICLGTGLDTY